MRRTPDCSSGGRPPLHSVAATPTRARAGAAAASSSSSSAAAIAPSTPKHHQPTNVSSSSAAATAGSADSVSRTSSSGSLVPYDERHLHDADHSPSVSAARKRRQQHHHHHQQQQPTTAATTENVPADNDVHASYYGAQNHPYPLSPPPATGHRRRRGGGGPQNRSSSSSPSPSVFPLQAAASSSATTLQQHRAGRRVRPSRRRGSNTAAGGSSYASAASLSDNATAAAATAASLRPVLAALSRALYHMAKSICRSAMSTCASVVRRAASRRWVRVGCYLVSFVLVAFLTLIGIAARGFFVEASDLCAVPAATPAAADGGGNGGGGAPPRPLVEYYVHGRGNGHYARSVAIIERLNDAGVDVRMFIGRATMWRAVNEAHLSSSSPSGNKRGAGGGRKDGGGDGGTTSSEATTMAAAAAARKGVGKGSANKKGKGVGGGDSGARRGVTTAISVTSITPSMDLFAALSHILERVTGDCEVARQTGRYPDLVVSDGDVPGMLRAYFGSVPSVGISHGQTFSIGVKPPWVRSDARYDAAWERQRALNWRAAFLTDWQIGTSFAGSMEARSGTGVIAMSPMRPEAVGMARERWRRRKVGRREEVGAQSSSAAGAIAATANATGASAADFASAATATAGGKFLSPMQRAKIDSLLLGDSETKHASTLPRRKLVICYFRDKNGDVLQNALLRSGFDVLLFERGYHKGLMNIRGVEKFGHKWIVDRETEDEMAGMSLDEYWREMLAKTNAKLLTDEAAEHMRSGDKGFSASDGRNSSLVGTGSRRNKGQRGKTGRRRRLSARADFGGTTTSRHNIDISPPTSDPPPPRIIRVTDMSLFVPLMSIADGVASSAGSQLISECIYSRTPILSLYRESDDEQMLNVMMYRHAREKIDVGKVVHGISLEAFSEAFSFLSLDGLPQQEPAGNLRGSAVRPNIAASGGGSDLGVDGGASAAKLLSKEQEFLLLRSPEAKRAYSEFDQFVEAVIGSTVSSSYYDEMLQSDASKAGSDEGQPATSAAELGEGWTDPFQGMADAAPVILEILKQVVNGA